MDTNFPPRADAECACARCDISAAAAAKRASAAANADQFAIATETRYDNVLENQESGLGWVPLPWDAGGGRGKDNNSMCDENLCFR